MLLDLQQQAINIRKRKVRPTEFEVLTCDLNKLAQQVGENWQSLTPEQKEQFQTFANKLTDASVPPINNLSKLRTGLSLLPIFLNGYGEAFIRCVDALDHLIDRIFDAIEREDDRYQKILADSVEHFEEGSGSLKALDVEIGSGWLKQLSDQAIEEV